MHKPQEGDCPLDLFDFETVEGKTAFWQSKANLLLI